MTWITKPTTWNQSLCTHGKTNHNINNFIKLYVEKTKPTSKSTPYEDVNLKFPLTHISGVAKYANALATYDKATPSTSRLERRKETHDDVDKVAIIILDVPTRQTSIIWQVNKNSARGDYQHLADLVANRKEAVYISMHAVFGHKWS